MKINKRQGEAIRSDILLREKNFTADKLPEIIVKASQKTESLQFDPPTVLLPIWTDIIGMLERLRIECEKENFTDSHYVTIAAVAMDYFSRSTDIIPDYLPAIGYSDDAFVFSFAIERLQKRKHNRSA